jgi:hypothetical protein
MASINNVEHLLDSGLGEFVRSSVCHFASQISDDGSSITEEDNIVMDLFYCLNLGSMVCTVPDNSTRILGDDDEFLRASVRLLKYRVIDAASVMLLWNFLESYSHQEKVLAAEPSVVKCLYDALSPGDNDLDTERNEGVIGCLSCLARNRHCLQSMMDLDIPSKLVQWIEDETETMHCFFTCMVLVHLATNWVAVHIGQESVSLTGNMVDYKSKLPISLKLGLQIVNVWITQKVTVEELRAKTKDCYSWHSIRPFLNLLWSVLLEARRFASLSLAVILQGSENRDICFMDVGSRDCGIIQCAGWSQDKEVRRYSRLAMDYVSYISLLLLYNVNRLDEILYMQASSDGILPPKLQDMCRFHVSENYYNFSSMAGFFPFVSRMATPFSMTLM